jgi:hypothetical protein
VQGQAKGDGMKCPQCGDPQIWHIVGGLENPVPWQVWHQITQGRFKPSDLFDIDRGTIRRDLLMFPTVHATRVRLA